MMSEKERRQAIKEIIQDFDDLQFWMRSLYLDGLNDQELTRLNFDLGQTWLIVFKARKKYGSVNDPVDRPVKAPTIPVNAPKTQEVPIHKENAKRNVENLFKEIKKATEGDNE